MRSRDPRAATHILLAPVLLVVALTGCAAPRRAPAAPPWRGALVSLQNTEEIVAAAKELRFNALIAHAGKERMKAFSELAKKNGIESYYWFSITGRDKAMAPFLQKMGPSDEKRLAELRADKDRSKHGYQFGGEPLPGRRDVLMSALLCFHHPETAAYCKKRIREMLTACPALTGVAFDFFGYQDLRCCRCPQSMKLFQEFRRSHPELTPDKALVRFSRDTLVAFTNEMADYARAIEPGAKVAIHVYPVFQPEPLYGNRLDVDYCCQTAAWFFEPYWSDEKVRRYARAIVREQKRHHARANGIPFIGLYVGRPYCDKPPERFMREVRLIREATGSDSLSVYRFNDVLKSPKIFDAMKEDVRARFGP